MSSLRAAIEQVRHDGRQRDVRCPGHDDQRASLSVGRGDDGRVLLHCQAGCEPEAVLAAAGMTWADLMPEKATTKALIVAAYNFRDETGTHLYDEVRFAPKDFRQRRADGTWSMKGVRRVLYRLNELQRRAVVYATEGPKDADRLWSLGLTATTNVGGAGKWKPEYTEQLVKAGVRHVVILPDNDDPGRAHAEQIARSCSAAGLRVKVVTLPDLSPKGDVSDWLDAGHTRDELVALVKQTALYSAPAPVDVLDRPASPTPIVTYLHNVVPEAVEWLWTGRFAIGKYTLIAGEPGIGKTYLVTDAAARISRGGRWPDGTPAPLGRVLYLTAEDGIADTIRPRLDAMGGDPSRVAVLEAIREANGSRRSLSLVRDLDMLAMAIRDVEPSLVVIDPITAYLGQVDTHRDADVRSALAPVTDLAADRRFALVTIGHLSKDAQRAALHRPGGSIAFVAAARLVLAVAADPNVPERRLLAPIKGNICRPAPVLAYRITEAGTLAWEADPVTGADVDAIFQPANPSDREERSDAEGVIHGLLDDGEDWPMDARRAIEAGQAHGIPDRTMRHTAKRMGIRITRLGFGSGGRWVWHRPIGAPIEATSPRTPHVAPIAPMPIHSDIGANNNIEAMKSVHGEDVDADGVF